LEFLEQCRRFISVESTPSTGNVDAAQLAAQWCQDAGLHVTLQDGVIAGVAQANLIARPVTDRPDNEILFQTHLDTTSPGTYSLWTETDRNPFNATIHGDRIYGLGAANSKLDFLCKLRAIKQVGKKKWKTPFVLVGTYGQEIGMFGAKKIIQNEMISARQALIGEPTDMYPVLSCNGSVVAEFFLPFSEEEKGYRTEHEQAESTATQSRIFRGKAAHSSTPQLGENAIMKLVRYLNELPESITVLTMDGGTHHNIVPDQAFIEVDMSISFQNNIGKKFLRLVREMESLSTTFLNYQDAQFNPPIPTFNVGVVRTYEDGIQVMVNLRLTPSVTESALQEWRTRIRGFCQTIDVRFRTREYKPPVVTSNDAQIVRSSLTTLESMGQSFQPTSKSTTNESSIYSGSGMSCLVIGPGSLVGNSHGPNEFNSLSQLETATAFYAKMIESMCL
jgi:acetylornithine deacetylase/succinyl-diaminopimelate desuccinylase-like protein